METLKISFDSHPKQVLHNCQSLIYLHEDREVPCRSGR